MLPPYNDFVHAVSNARRRREAEAEAERLRPHGRLRVRAASLLRGLADRLDTAPSLPSADCEPAGRFS
jgi:hypothetical protein